MAQLVGLVGLGRAGPVVYRVQQSRDKDGCTPNVRVPMVLIGLNYIGILGDNNP